MFNGKNVVITGGSRGIGFATAKIFAEANANVLITGRNEEALKNACAEIGRNCRYIIWDIARLDVLDDKINECIQNLGRIDVFVNNAGALVRESPMDVTHESWELVINTNMSAVFFACQKLIDYMIKNDIHGHIVNVASENAFMFNANPYYISKWGTRAITGGWGLYAAPYGIVVNGVAPGATKTDMTKGADNPANIPRGKLAKPEEIGELIKFLASPAADNIIGETVLSTGGHNLQVPW